MRSKFKLINKMGVDPGLAEAVIGISNNRLKNVGRRTDTEKLRQSLKTGSVRYMLSSLRQLKNEKHSAMLITKLEKFSTIGIRKI